MTEVERIRDQLRRAYDGDCWFGPGVRPIIQEVTPEQSAFRLQGMHSICELVWHMVAWKRAVIEWLQGSTEDVEQERSFRGGASDWPAALDALDAAQKELLAQLETIDDGKLGQIVPIREYTFYFALHGVIQHDVYHGGQIQALKRLSQ